MLHQNLVSIYSWEDCINRSLSRFIIGPSMCDSCRRPFVKHLFRVAEIRKWINRTFVIHELMMLKMSTHQIAHSRLPCHSFGMFCNKTTCPVIHQHIHLYSTEVGYSWWSRTRGTCLSEMHQVLWVMSSWQKESQCFAQRGENVKN